MAASEEETAQQQVSDGEGEEGCGEPRPCARRVTVPLGRAAPRRGVLGQGV